MGQPQEIVLQSEPPNRRKTDPEVGQTADRGQQSGILQTWTPSGDWVRDIADMHTKYGVNPVIRNLEAEQLKTFLQFRIDFLKEELDEMVDAVFSSDYEKPENRAEDIVDALIDLCVVAIGTLNAFDVNAHEAWKRVHEKNMQKQTGVNPNRPNPLGLPDLIKPQGWTSPTHFDNVGLLSRIF